MDRIEEFIRNSRKDGFSELEIKRVLREEGLTEKRIEEAFRKVDSGRVENRRDADSDETAEGVKDDGKHPSNRRSTNHRSQKASDGSKTSSGTLWRFQYYALILSASVALLSYIAFALKPAVVFESVFTYLGVFPLIPILFVFLTSFIHLFKRRTGEFAASGLSSFSLIAVPALTGWFVVLPILRGFQGGSLFPPPSSLMSLGLLPHLYNLEILLLTGSVSYFGWRYHRMKSLAYLGSFVVIAVLVFVSSSLAIQDIQADTTMESEPPISDLSDPSYGSYLDRTKFAPPPFQRALLVGAALGSASSENTLYASSLGSIPSDSFCAESSQNIGSETSNIVQRFYYLWKSINVRIKNNQENVGEELVQKCRRLSDCSASRQDISQSLQNYLDLQEKRIQRLSEAQGVKMDKDLIPESCKASST